MQENNNNSISIPVNNIIIDKDGNIVEQKNTVSPLLINTEYVNDTYSPINSDEKFISSIQYIPDFLQDKPVFKDASKLLDILVTDADQATLKEINQAYCDTLYKYSAYNKLSYGAKITFLQEKGFDYVLDLLLHMYDDEYNTLVNQYKKGELESIPTYEEFVQQKADARLTKIVTLFNFINVLKGKTVGLELVLKLVDMPEYNYMPYNVVANYKGEWEGAVSDLPLPNGTVPVKAGDCYSKTVGPTTNYFIYNGVAWHQTNTYTDYLTPREPITAILDVYGASSQDLQRRLTIFTRHYMLPVVNVSLKFTAEVPTVWAYPSGIFELFKLFELYDYYDNNGEHLQKELIHKVSDEHWYYSDTFEKCPITFGIPVGVDDGRAFKGSVDLTKSFVEDEYGVRHYMYGSDPTLHKAIGGTATDRMKQTGIIDNYDDIYYLQVPIEDYVEVDFVTGDQMNPYYDENGVFCRDTFINHCYTLMIENIHLAKTIEQMQALLVEDFDKIFGEGEVWLGMSTSVECVAGKDYKEDFSTAIDEQRAKYETELLKKGVPLQAIDEYVAEYKITKNDTSYYNRYIAQQKIDELLEQYPDLEILAMLPYFYTFTYSDPYIRPETGVEDVHLVFCEAEVEDDCYTGIGDLGILGANDYFLYNGMLLYHGDTKLKQIGESKKWTDVGASHAVSEMYYTPAICDGKLYWVHQGEIAEIPRDENDLSGYTIHVTEHPQIIVDELEDDNTVEEVDKEPVKSFEYSWREIDEDFWGPIEGSMWTHVTGYVNNFYNAFGICDGRLYLIGVQPDDTSTSTTDESNTDEEFPNTTPQPDIENTDSADEVDASKIVYRLIDETQGWTYITGVDYSETYEAYGIRDEKLYRITADGVTEVKISDVQSTVGVEGNIEYKNHIATFTTYLKDGSYGKDSIEIILDEENQTVTDIKFNGTSTKFTVDGNSYTSTDSDLYEIYYDPVGDTIESISMNTATYECLIYFMDNSAFSFNLAQQSNIVGWDSSFDCISRYHHCNNQYTTYGICKGVLYSLNSDNVKVLDDSRVYTAICGYYNDNSPRTFAYAIDENGYLYQIKGNTIELKDDTRYWTEIHGCSTANNNYIIGIAKNNKEDESGYIYSINAKTIDKLEERDGWTKCFGRYTTSKSPSNVCYGYGVRNGKLYQFTNKGMLMISGFWKKDGEHEIVELKDYNIESITLNLNDENNTTYEGEQAIREVAPVEGTVLSDYDIYITYTTRGFNNNTRYIIRTERTETHYTYIHPEECRSDVSEEFSYDLFDTTTGTMTGFVSRNFEITGTDLVDGNGDARGFLNEKSYITLPESIYWDPVSVVVDFSCTVQGIINPDELLPVTLDENGYGVFYGKNSDGIYGVFAKTNTNNIVKLADIPAEDAQTTEKVVRLRNFTIKYTVIENGHCSISITDENGTFTTPFISTDSDYVDVAKYLGGNGTIFGDAIIHLHNSYMITTDIGEQSRINLFENGRYFSVDTQSQNVVEELITDTTQNISKVIEVVKENGEVLEFSMDQLYTQMIPTCPTEDLTVTTDYNFNRLQHDPYEGTSYATLTYSGAFELDPDKVTSNIPLRDVCNFDNDGIAENLNGLNKVVFKLSTDVTTPIYIQTTDKVDVQGILRTEEDYAFTNDYLLQSYVTLEHSDVACRAVPSGIVYELYSNEPQVATSTLTYNNESFALDDNKITDYSRYDFDSYQAMLTFTPSYTYDEEDIFNEMPIYEDAWCNIKLNTNDTKNDDGSISAHLKLHILSKIKDELFMKVDTTEFKTLVPEEPNTSGTEYYYNIDVRKEFVDVNRDFLIEVDPAVEEKDKLQYEDGQCWNFSLDSFFTFNDTDKVKELVLCLFTDDDTSKDQGIFGNPDNFAGFGIKDNMWTYTDVDGVAYKSDVVAKDNAIKYVRFLKHVNNKNIVDIYVANSLEPLDEDIYTSEGEVASIWTLLFENMPISVGKEIVGYASVQGEYLPYNGTVDLAQSYVVYDEEVQIETPDTNGDGENETTTVIEERTARLYDMIQTTKVYGSPTGEEDSFTLLEEVITPYVVFNLNMGYQFTGMLDCYYSELLVSYDLGWVENRTAISNVVKNEIQKADRTYNPALDDKVYDITEFGIYLEAEPKRWDTITVTYTTEDKAFYMEPNTSYTLGMEVEEDKEAGKLLVSVEGTPTWDEGILSDFENGYCTYELLSTEKYMVLKLQNANYTDTDAQAICGYIDEYKADTASQCIYIENNSLKYFDDIEEHVLIDNLSKVIGNNKIYYIRIYMNEHAIEYSLDGENFVSTEVLAAFTGYETLAIGNGFAHEKLAPYRGKIYINESYIQTGEDKTYLFKHYKKVIPYIIDTDGSRYNLVLTPMLTIRDFVEFAYSFDGIIDFYNSGLLLEDTKYWAANQVSIYNKSDGSLNDIVIRDSLSVDENLYTTVNTQVRINPTDLYVYYEGAPKIGSKILLTYDTWYLFRERYTRYNFKINYLTDENGDPNGLASISFTKAIDIPEDADEESIIYPPEYTIYITESQEMTIRTGFQFNGILHVYNSTRGGMRLCDHRIWDTFLIKYRKYDSDPNVWDIWTEFIRENTFMLYQRIGYELKGVHYLASSWFKTSQIESPFVTYYNSYYIIPVGNLSFTPDGIVSDFASDSYLAVVMDHIFEGYKVSFFIHTGDDIRDQGVSTWVKGIDGEFISDDGDPLNILRPDYTYIVQYIFGSYGITVHDVDVMYKANLDETLNKYFLEASGNIVVRVMGYNVGEINYVPSKSEKYMLTVVPYNPNHLEGATGYYITSLDQANNVTVEYRKVENEYDHFTGEGEDTWYKAELVMQEVEYFDKKLNVYAATVPFGYTQFGIDYTNENPDGVEYNKGDLIEFRVISGITTYMTVVPYNNLVKKQKATF